ncbi:DUF2911 domain-containing protein [Fulvivirga sediminis]|uniref:DUF2911 domain-containing protein n=1 Tax=Fulvivirga sediminis TaxID=2803949 RepID=A0A937F895_9BACT|nr:DUF2911 domain-containing protein [Fulvivirga sediminis]MBL3658146.1 DUF2911 domain-containing protein [Fulvivirga sediminis]
MKSTPLITFILLLISCSVFAQEAITPRPSPTAIITMKYEETYVKVTYSQPHKRNRKIFGTLVPYGQVWRTGANEATEITLTGDVLLNETDTLKAGTYSIFSIPNADKWTIIINKELGQWGAYNYNQEADALRFEVPTSSVKPGVVWEPFTMAFEQSNEKAKLVMMWDQTKVEIPMAFIEKD